MVDSCGDPARSKRQMQLPARTPAENVSTRCQAIAAAIFGDRVLKPGVHCTAPDADGFKWYLCVADDGRVMCCSFLPEDLDSGAGVAQLKAWRARHHSAPAPRLSLVR